MLKNKKEQKIETRTNSNGETLIIELENKKSSSGNQLKRFLYFSLGIIGLLFPPYYFFTIIGILPGIRLAFFSIAFMYKAMGKQIVKCSNSNKKQPVVHNY